MTEPKTQTTLTEEQIKAIMPEFADFGEQVIGKATLYYLCQMALHTAPVELAIRELREMIDGGDECRGRDSQLSHTIGILEKDENHLFLARKSRPVKKTAEDLTDEIFTILREHRPHYQPHSPSTYQEILNLILQELPE